METLSRPKYRRIFAAIDAELAGGQYRSGDQLPSERELARRFSVSLLTVRQSLRLLEEQGKVSREQGRGTFVLPEQGAQFHTLDGSHAAADTRSIAFCLAEEEASGFYNVELQHLTQSMEDCGYHIVFCSLSLTDLVAGKMPLALERKAARAIFLDGSVQDAHVAALRKYGLPILVLGNHRLSGDAPQVQLDFEAVSRQLTTAIMQQCGGPCWLVTEPMLLHYTRSLHRGYLAACQEAGQPALVDLLEQRGRESTDFRRTPVHRRLELLAAEGKPFGLLLHQMDFVAEFVAAYKALGLPAERYPIVTGFNPTYQFSSQVTERVSVCVVDNALSAQAAARMMEQLLEGRAGPRCLNLAPAVVLHNNKFSLAWSDPTAASSCE